MSADKDQNQDQPSASNENVPAENADNDTTSAGAAASASAGAAARASAWTGVGARADSATAAESAGEEAGEAASTLLAAEAALAAAQAEAADLKDRLLRAVAETENLRRRTDRELADARKYAVTEFARDVLGVSDNLRRALEAVSPEAREAHDEVTQLLEGVELTERELLSHMEKHGIRKIDPLGEKLDPNLHQAMIQIDDPDAAPGTIVQVMQVGYVIHDRLLRAAMVGVAKGGQKPAPDNNDEPGQTIDTQA